MTEITWIIHCHACNILESLWNIFEVCRLSRIETFFFQFSSNALVEKKSFSVPHKKKTFFAIIPQACEGRKFKDKLLASFWDAIKKSGSQEDWEFHFSFQFCNRKSLEKFSIEQKKHEILQFQWNFSSLWFVEMLKVYAGECTKWCMVKWSF